MREIRNAVIKRTFLGTEDYGIPTCSISLDYGDSGQSFGGYDLRYYGFPMLAGILRVAGAESWEQLVGKHLRADQDHCKVHRIGHLLKDDWFEPEKDLQKFVAHK